MEPRLEELIKSRKELIEVFSKSALSDGISSLLTDLYPENAHFIYELLQNAEDMNADEVHFSLSANGIDFDHNGTKRSFDIDDIDAITNIKQYKQKKDDPVESGKFGVGFKAVFAYTSTPEIHSGEYHFRIRDYCVPEFDNVEKAETIDREGVSWTKFRLPFNCPDRSSSDSFRELSDELRKLDESVMLFLQNIKKIVYKIGDGKKHIFTRTSDSEHIIKTTRTDPSDPEKHIESEWLFFSKPVLINDDHTKKKSFPVAAAFALKWSDEKKRNIVVPVRHPGRTFIYFPADRENSGLQFYINAPFASNAARNCINDCEENSILIQKISDLIFENLTEIREMGLLDENFIEVLPNKEDIENYSFISVYNKIIIAFMTYEIYPVGANQYKKAEDLITGPAEIFNLINTDDFFKITGKRKYWIQAPSDSRLKKFSQNLNIEEYDESILWSIFPDNIKNIINDKDDNWLKDFYCLCNKLYTKDYYKFSFSFSTPILTKIKMSDILLSETNEYHKPQDLYIGNPEDYSDTNNSLLIKRSLLDTNDIRYNEIIKFFREILGVRDYGQNIVIENKLKKYVKKKSIKAQDISSEYFSDLLTIAEYDKLEPIIKLSGYRLFLYDNGEELVFEKPDKLYLGKDYGYSDGQKLADNLSAPVLWHGYFDHCTDEQIELIISFAQKCGIKKGLSIINCSAEDNPEFESLLKSEKESDGSGTNIDYDIPDLESLLEKNNTDINLIIWKHLKNCFKKDYAYASYSPDKDSKVRTCDSRFIYTLRHQKWLPDKNGDLFRPDEIFEEDLDSRFEYSFIFPLLKSLQLYDKAKKEADEIEKLKEKAISLGYRLITEEEGKEFDEYKKKMLKYK